MIEEQIITLFSKQRLESYDNDLDKHFDNLRLIAWQYLPLIFSIL
ncbi:hypothetical protein [Helicobacter cinaedi]|nr:hypothetical protein [Helicobacter cinaedi]BBB19072.1 hypothetical protein HC081234_02490 [Helicobacter cinaedi]